MAGAIKNIAAVKSFSIIPSFLPLLLAPLLGRPRFCFDFFRTEGLAIDGMESKGREIAVGFSGCSL